MSNDAKLGANRSVRLQGDIVAGYDAMVELLIDAYSADGRPLFTEANTPYQQYQVLLAARGAGNPKFFNDPAAQAQLAELEQRYGPSQELSGPGYMPPRLIG